MWNKISGKIGGDLLLGYQYRSLFLLILFPLILIVLMLFAFPLLEDIIFRRNGFDLYRFYSLIAITLASLIPAFPTLILGISHMGELNRIGYAEEGIPPRKSKLSFRKRVVSVLLVTLILLLMFIFLVDPVTEEGWLRNCFVALLFALQAPLGYIFSSCIAGKSIKGFIFPSVCLLFVIAVPVGLVMYHPWNYLAFFSPFYWIAWAWVIKAPYESLIYGSISLAITFGYMYLLCRKLLKRQSSP